MKIYDAHIHAKGTKPAPEKMLNDMRTLGVYAGCVFSEPPVEQNSAFGAAKTFDARLEEVLNWSIGHEDRIFPIMWIYPYEENIIENIRRAVSAGVVGFKMICSDYYIYEEQPMMVLREIARLGVPVLFHSGILWDGHPSSKYNRPVNWESLLDIDGLKFSMGHCSWPWVDECVAMYGKFLDAHKGGKSAEMFFDITPGTPPLYRRELFTKLYQAGYDASKNILVGFDCIADSYDVAYAGGCLERDKKILDELGISRDCRENMYQNNLLRFLGKPNSTKPTENHTEGVNPEVRTVIEKWYKRLGFPAYYDREFYSALDAIPISDVITYDSYDTDCTDGKRNLLSYLFMCEDVERRTIPLGIPSEIITETFKDIVTWCKTWSDIKGELYLGELKWLKYHISGSIFRLGRLQFNMADAECDIEKYGIKKGDHVLEIHIPEGGKLTPELCQASLDMARKFFAEYFPDFNYKCFTCHSWLLDDTLGEYLPHDSGIMSFGNMFDKISADESYALIKYLFEWDTTPTNIKYRYPISSLAAKVRDAVLRGKKFHETLGVIEK